MLFQLTDEKISFYMSNSMEIVKQLIKKMKRIFWRGHLYQTSFFFFDSLDHFECTKNREQGQLGGKPFLQTITLFWKNAHKNDLLRT